jgi:serine/threonine protein kinase
MATHDAERYQHAQAIAHEVLELRPADRSPRILASCGDDVELQREVEWLIAAVEISDGAEHSGKLDDIAEFAGQLLADCRVEIAAPRQYRLIRLLGEGGMGQVWLAERDDGATRRRVALKMLRGTGALSEGERARFAAEGRILASLNHSNIAHIVDAGQGADGTPFLAMEYVDGERIDRWCAARALSVRARIELFLKVCAAVEYAHAQLVIHRDLKPANILVDAHAEPKLLDFGIARLLEASVGAGGATTVLRAMTLAYASPEQIEGRSLGIATDIYSLGVLLYELVAGVRPFEHIESEHARSNAIVSGEITPPSRRARGIREALSENRTASRPPTRHIPADVDAIVLRALRREPEQRYASVGEFAGDLRNFLVARPVLARRGQSWYRAQRFFWRNRWRLVATALMAVVATGFGWRIVLAERETQVQATTAGRVAEFIQSVFALSNPETSDRHDYSARELLDRGVARIAVELSDQPRVRARLLETLGNAYRGINEGSAGVPLLEEAARLNLDPAVGDPLAAARSLRALVRAALASRQSSDLAERSARRALELSEQYGAHDPRQLAEAYDTLAAALDSAGKLAEARTAAERGLALRERNDAAPFLLAQSQTNLCSIIGDQFELSDALRHCERALTLYRDASSARSNEYRLALIDYAAILAYHGDYAQSIATRREILALSRDLFGESSATLASDRLSLAERLSEQGQFAEAAELIELGTATRRRLDGEHSAQYAQAIFRAGWLQHLQGRYAAALPLLRRAVAICEEAVGDNDNDRLPVLRVDLADNLVEMGDAGAEARRLLDAVIAARSRVDPQAPDLAYARLPLARWDVTNGQFGDAARQLDLIEHAPRQVEVGVRARIALTRAEIARAQGDSAGVLRFEEKAYRMTLGDVGPTHPRTARYALLYARDLRAAGRTDEAEPLERGARPLFEKAYPRDSAFRRALSGS